MIKTITSIADCRLQTKSKCSTSLYIAHINSFRPRYVYGFTTAKKELRNTGVRTIYTGYLNIRFQLRAISEEDLADPFNRRLLTGKIQLVCFSSDIWRLGLD